MEVLSQSFEMVPISKLRAHPDNPRRGHLEALRISLQHNGWFGAIVVQRSTGYILAGNHRYVVAQQEGATALPVLWVDVDDQLAKRILLVDNRISDLAENDPQELLALLAELQQQDQTLQGTGYDEAAVEQLLRELAESAERNATATDTDSDTNSKSDTEPLASGFVTAPATHATSSDFQSAPHALDNREQFVVYVTCQDEAEQVSLLQRLQQEGFSCRALIS